METEEIFQVSSCDQQECRMVSGAWSMKMMAAHLKEIGGMDDGMDMVGPPLRTVIHMKESIDLINVMEGEFIIGQMDVSMMARLVKTSDMVRGTFKWPDGATYQGDFVQGQREGHGRYTFSDGGYYVGSWVDGRYDGFGECHWEDGRTYKGEWKTGMAHGQGVETYPDGRVRHDGQWNADEPIRSK